MRDVPSFILDLLHEPPGSDEYERAKRELETQPEYGPLLEEAALGGAQWWGEARETLRERGVPAPTGDQPTTVSALAGDEETKGDEEPDGDGLAFLDPPSHPELLGRFGRYEIEQLLGRGGMGVVLRAFDPELHRVVAIKVLAPHLAHNGAARQRFSREARAAAAVVHPHVVPIHNVDSDAKLPHIVMQFVPGESLQTRVERLGPLEVETALRIASQVADGLAAAHAQGLVHRDVKPANILLEEQTDRVMLTDFGLARAVDDASLTNTGLVTGTPDYMSPEQAFGESIDCRSDLFSLGSVLYFMLTGRPPFRADGAMAVLNRVCHQDYRPLQEVNARVPREVSLLIDECLSKRAETRVESAATLNLRINGLLSGLQAGQLSIQSRQEPSSRRPVAWKKATAMVALCVLLALVSKFAIDAQKPAASVGESEIASLSGAVLSDSQFERELRLIEAGVLELRDSSHHRSSIDSFEAQLRAIESEIHSLSVDL
ncbi:MAG: serine/threonine-protein kinase [Planctomycetota bacterium]